jgi:hypothetical protein
MVIQGVVPDLPDQTLVIEQTIATLWAGVQAVPRLPKSAITKRSGRSNSSKRSQIERRPLAYNDARR